MNLMFNHTGVIAWDKVLIIRRKYDFCLLESAFKSIWLKNIILNGYGTCSVNNVVVQLDSLGHLYVK